MFRKLLFALALIVPTVGASYAQTAAQANVGFLLAQGSTYNGYTCPSTATSPCFVQYGSTVPVSGSLTPSGTQDENLKQVNGATVNVGVGAASTGTQRVTTSTDSTIGTVTAVTSITNALPAGTNVIGQVNLAPSATIGLTTQSCTAACASTLVSGAHTLYGGSFSATVTGWLLVYDATSCSANGTVTPKKAIAYTTANTSIGFSWANTPIVNSTGIAACFSSTGPYTATASTTAFISVDYK